MSHTPAPWTADLTTPDDIVIYGPTLVKVKFGARGEEETNEFIANVGSAVDRHGQILQVAFDVTDEVKHDDATAAANARLMAAAPELYELLVLTVEQGMDNETPHVGRSIFAPELAAIRKANPDYLDIHERPAKPRTTQKGKAE